MLANSPAFDPFNSCNYQSRKPLTQNGNITLSSFFVPFPLVITSAASLFRIYRALSGLIIVNVLPLETNVRVTCHPDI